MTRTWPSRPATRIARYRFSIVKVGDRSEPSSFRTPARCEGTPHPPRPKPQPARVPPPAPAIAEQFECHCPVRQSVFQMAFRACRASANPPQLVEQLHRGAGVVDIRALKRELASTLKSE